jgi:hypothetical protein
MHVANRMGIVPLSLRFEGVRKAIDILKLNRGTHLFGRGYPAAARRDAEANDLAEPSHIWQRLFTTPSHAND